MLASSFKSENSLLTAPVRYSLVSKDPLSRMILSARASEVTARCFLRVPVAARDASSTQRVKIGWAGKLFRRGLSSLSEVAVTRCTI